MILLVDNLLNFFYECTLIVSWTTNTDIHLRFQIFNALFNHLEQIEKNIRKSTCLLNAVIVKTCKNISIKLAKYYVKIKDSNKIIYNLANILNFTMKLNQSQHMHNKSWKRALHARQSKSKEWSNENELHELQQCKFEDDCKWCWHVARKQRRKIATLTQWWREDSWHY